MTGVGDGAGYLGFRPVFVTLNVFQGPFLRTRGAMRDKRGVTRVARLKLRDGS